MCFSINLTQFHLSFSFAIGNSQVNLLNATNNRNVKNVQPIANIIVSDVYGKDLFMKVGVCLYYENNVGTFTFTFRIET